MSRLKFLCAQLRLTDLVKVLTNTGTGHHPTAKINTISISCVKPIKQMSNKVRNP